MRETNPSRLSGTGPAAGLEKSDIATGPSGPRLEGRASYVQIFKSTALIGGASAIDIALRIIRVKLIAVLLGPAGIGLFSLFNSIDSLARSLGGFGMNLSGARQIAEASGSDDSRRIALTVITLRRMALVFGAAGTILLAIMSQAVARITFGNVDHAGGVLLLSLTVLFSTVTEAQSAVLRGLRRIGDLATLGVLAAFLGTVGSILLVYFLREGGVALSIVSVAGSGVVTSWWFARKVQLEPVTVTYQEISAETALLLKLGFVLMLSALLPTMAAYATRTMVQHHLGMDAAGYHQAAWAVSVLYVNFIMQAMAMDFYPRLSAASKDHQKCNQMMNEQAEMGMLLAGPGVLGTLTFAPLIIHLLYSAKFGPTIELLRWNCLGMMIQIAIWPLATLQLAQGRGNLFLLTQFTAHAVTVGLTWIGIRVWGLNGTGIASCSMAIVQGLISYGVARRLSGFRWSPINLRLGAVFLTLIVAVFLSWYVQPFPAATALGTGATIITGAYSLRLLCTVLPVEKMPSLARKAITLLRLAPSVPKG